MNYRPIQKKALDIIRECKGAIIAAGVGHGKTLISLSVPVILDAKSPLLLIPASNRAQYRREAEKYRSLGFDIWFEEDRILHYEMLSRPGSAGFLDSLEPDLIVADECHNLKHWTSTRTRRFTRYMDEHEGTIFIGLSGTIFSKRFKEFWHLLISALKDNAPVPWTRTLIESFSAVFDHDGQPSRQDIAAVQRFTDCNSKNRSDLRKAYRQLLAETPGVVLTEEGSVECSLVIRVIEVDEPWEVKQAVRNAEDYSDCSPESWALVERRSQLQCGFYYKAIWRDGRVDFEWLKARKDWYSFVGRELENPSHAKEGDSPARIAKATEEGLYGLDAKRLLRVWQEQKTKPAPGSEAVWIDKYLVHLAHRIAVLSPEPTIIWYGYKAVEDLLRDLGIPVFGANAKLPEVPITCGMSWNAHGQGKNLQAWSRCVILNPPSSAVLWEQLIGRLHRYGQEADEVEVIVPLVGIYRDTLENAYEEAKSVQDMTGQKQKLLYATYVEEEQQ